MPKPEKTTNDNADVFAAAATDETPRGGAPHNDLLTLYRDDAADKSGGKPSDKDAKADGGEK